MMIDTEVLSWHEFGERQVSHFSTPPQKYKYKFPKRNKPLFTIRITLFDMFDLNFTFCQYFPGNWRLPSLFLTSFRVIFSHSRPIDSQLNFDEQVSLICKKVNDQLNVMIRFRKLVNTSTLLQLYKVFVLPRFQFFSVVWHFCSSRNSEKLESLNKRALHVIFDDRESTLSHLLDKATAHHFTIWEYKIC